MENNDYKFEPLDRVRASDRDNFGIIVKVYSDDTATVKFYNKDTQNSANVRLPLSILKFEGKTLSKSTGEVVTIEPATAAGDESKIEQVIEGIKDIVDIFEDKTHVNINGFTSSGSKELINTQTSVDQDDSEIRKAYDERYFNIVATYQTGVLAKFAKSFTDIVISFQQLFGMNITDPSRQKHHRVNEFNGLYGIFKKKPGFIGGDFYSLVRFPTGAVGILGLTNTGKTTALEYLYTSLFTMDKNNKPISNDSVIEYASFGEPSIPSITKAEDLIALLEEFLDSDKRVICIDSFTFFLYNVLKKSSAAKAGIAGVFFTDLTALSNAAAAKGKTILFIVNPLTNDLTDANRLYDVITSRVSGMIKVNAPGEIEMESRDQECHREKVPLYFPLPWEEHVASDFSAAVAKFKESLEFKPEVEIEDSESREQKASLLTTISNLYKRN